MAALGRFAVHHVGGRNGVRVFPICPRFEADIVSVFYDADADCLPQIKARNAGLPSELHVLPLCLWSTTERRSLNIATDPYASSLLPFNPVFAERTEFALDHDYRYGDTLRPARVMEVETTTLDLALGKPDAPQAPDFLSIDVQGAELEVLKGGRNIVEQDVVAIQLEVEFIELYRDQPLFTDILRHLEKAGFEFLRFLHQGRAYARPAPIGLRAETCDMSADALFVKRPSHPLMDEAKTAKLAFIATNFSHFDLAANCLDRLPSGWLARAGDSGPGASIARFLKSLDEARRSTAGYRPWSFTDKWPISENRPRFMIGEEFDGAAKRLAARRKSEEARIRDALPELKKLGSDVPYGIEPVLIAHDFTEQAENLKIRRISEVGALLNEITGGRVF